MKKLLLVFFLIFQIALHAQTKNNDYKKVDEVIKKYSNPIDNNAIRGVARFIYENFSTETDKLRAVFIWLSDNFEYDVENMYNPKAYTEPQEVIDEMLRNQKGVCMHFAYLFKEIGSILDIKSYIISGYTKQDGVVNNLSHVWCASFMDSAWHLIDPTWGAGYVQNNKYVRKLNDDYFKATPEELIKSHIPLDPLWQFLNYPVSAQEFYDGHTKINKEKPFFDFLDTLKMYEEATRMEQLIATNRRIEQNGMIHVYSQNQLENNKKEIEFYKLQIDIEYYNSAVNYFNEGINYLNRFIDYRNKQFQPQKSETEVRLMIEEAEVAWVRSQEELQKISTSDVSTKNSKSQLEASITQMLIQVYEQKNFVNKYFNTSPLFRKSLFY